LQGKSDEDLDKALNNSNEINLSEYLSSAPPTHSVAPWTSPNNLTQSSTSPALHAIGGVNHSNTSNANPFTAQSQSISTSNSINMALYQYDYNIKAAKFANSNQTNTSLFNSNSINSDLLPPSYLTSHIQHQHQQQTSSEMMTHNLRAPTPPLPTSRPEKTKSIVFF
jgi:hypothetical protein